jgi:peptidyl-prolyl cis-trans isomerase C
MKPILKLALLALLQFPFALLGASPNILVTGPGGMSVSEDELLAEASARLPADVRSQALKDPRNVSTLASEIAIRRTLAMQALDAGLDKDPDVAVKLRLARERVLTDARLAQIDAKAPDRSAVERVASAEYRAETGKFLIPEQVRVRHILIDVRSCEAEKRAGELRDRARAPGADFAALATEFSHDPGSAKRGGDLGFFERGRMAPEFEKAAFAMTRPGEISDIVRTSFGYHVIRFEERRAAAREPFEKVRDSLIKDIERREQRSRRAAVTEPISAGLRIDASAVEEVARKVR